MMIVLLLFLYCQFSFSITCSPEPGTPVNKPLGSPRGIKPGRVSWYYNPEACSWDGTSKYYWSENNINQTLVDEMVQKTILNVAGESDLAKAWDKIFRYFNVKHSGKNVGYQKGEKIAMKVNLNVLVGYDSLSNANSVSPQFLKSVLKSLIMDGGVDQKDVTPYDAARWFIPIFYDAPTGVGQLFPDITFGDADGGEKYTRKVLPDENVDFFFSNYDVAGWNISKLPELLTEAKYLIVVDAFRGHNLAGFTMSGKNWFGSIYRPDNTCPYSKSGEPGHWCPRSLHQWVNMTGVDFKAATGDWQPQQEMAQYNALVDLLGHDSTVYGKGLISFSDALYGGYDELNTPPIKFAMEPFNGSWSCSAFASLDAIALDSVGFDFLRSEPNQPWPKVGCVDNYLHECALANDPPSGVKYAPSGHKIDSIGVHEHWNNAKDMEYSRNLGVGEGIELIKVHEL